MPVTLALKTCPTCGNGFVDNPAACPFCAAPLPTPAPAPPSPASSPPASTG
jgi:predicted amidophosphoribosyltransferase